MLAFAAPNLGYTRTETKLFAKLHLVTLQKGIVPMVGADHAVVEIGCSDRDTLDETDLPKDKRAFLLSFEPLIDKYATLLARARPWYSRQRAVPLGHHHPRGVVFPLAVSTTEGQQTIRVHAVSGCSSLLPLNTQKYWASHCQKVAEKRTVGTLTLERALAMTGTLPVKLIKLDAQGMDFKVVKATPKAALDRVQAISMEVRRSLPCPPLYESTGKEACPEVVSYMSSIGFVTTSDCKPGSFKGMSRWCEGQFLFTRREPAPNASVGGLRLPSPVMEGAAPRYLALGPLSSDLHVAHLLNGTLALPETTTHLLVEIGGAETDPASTLDERSSKLEDEGAFLVSYQPVQDVYAALLARARKRYHPKGGRDLWSRLGHHHRRGVVLPFAVRADEGVHRLKLPVAREANSPASNGGEDNAATETRLVDSLTLTEALALAGSLPIRLLLIDARCRDAGNLHAIKAAPLGTLARVEIVRLRGVATRSGATCVKGQRATVPREQLAAAGFGEPREDGDDLVFRRAGKLRAGKLKP